MPPATPPARRLSSAKRAILALLANWARHEIWNIIAAIIFTWLIAALALHLVEPSENAGFATFGDALWNTWGTLFSGGEAAPQTFVGRSIVAGVMTVGVALAGLFTASVASILIDRSLRRRQVTTLEMSNHLVLCNWAPRAMQWIREVHSNIVTDKRPIVIIHDNPEEIELPDKQDDPAFNDIYIVKGDPANEVILRRAKAGQAYSVVILSDDRQGAHADGKTIVSCIAVKNVCRGEQQPNIVAECRDPKFAPHMRKAGADEVMSAAEFGLRLLARASLFHGMTRVYQELLTVGRNANEMYMVPVPESFVGADFATVARVFVADRSNANACLLIGIFRGETMMLNPVGSEAGPLRVGDELILLSPKYPDLSGMKIEPAQDPNA